MADAKISALTNNTTPAYGDMVTLVNVDGADATQRTSLGLLQNWVTVDDAWAYASATTITVPSGAASIYSVGDKVKFTQTTVKYFYVVGVADTVLTVTGGSAYTVANAAISVIAFSKSVSPVGFPKQFSLTAPTWTTTGAAFTNQPVNSSAVFVINGRSIRVFGTAQCHATSGGTGHFIATFTSGQLPAADTTYKGSGACLNISTIVKTGFCYINASNVLYIFAHDGTELATNSEYFTYSTTWIIP